MIYYGIQDTPYLRDLHDVTGNTNEIYAPQNLLKSPSNNIY